MVRRLALLQRENPDPNPETWYYSKYGEEPDYSNLLEALAKTPAERQKLLQEYWEPNDQDRKEGRKQPTRAHRAIATLVAEGYIRVILTTNFDHLMEEALRDEGIEPTVLSTPDQVENAVPLVHARCCVVKLHGDYLDPRIRNTSTELQSYSPEFNKLLDQVFDEFGLIVCGWSAQWDKALRDVFYRCQSHQVQESPGHGQVGDVSRPHLVRPGDRQIPRFIARSPSVSLGTGMSLLIGQLEAILTRRLDFLSTIVKPKW